MEWLFVVVIVGRVENNLQVVSFNHRPMHVEDGQLVTFEVRFGNTLNACKAWDYVFLLEIFLYAPIMKPEMDWDAKF